MFIAPIFHPGYGEIFFYSKIMKGDIILIEEILLATALKQPRDLLPLPYQRLCGSK
jgi:hypothetical protein